MDGDKRFECATESMPSANNTGASILSPRVNVAVILAKLTTETIREARPETLKTHHDRLSVIAIYRGFALTVVIFANDHEPSHVHVFGDGEAKVNLVRPGGKPELVRAYGMKRSDVRHAMKLVESRQSEFLMRWKEIHG